MANRTIKKIIQILLEEKATELDDETKRIIDKIMKMSNKEIWEFVNTINQDWQVEVSKTTPNLFSTNLFLTGSEDCADILTDPEANEEEKQKAWDDIYALRATYFLPACERIATKYSVTVQFLHIIEELMYIKFPSKTQLKV